jgi:ATP-binding cassette subfamily F protein uup
MAESPFFIAHNVSLSRGNKTLFSNVNFSIHAGDRIGIVGANGSGKSSLLGVISARFQPDAGRTALRSDVTVAYIEQEFIPPKNPSLTVSDYLKSLVPQELCSASRGAELQAALGAHCELLNDNSALAETDDWQYEFARLQTALENVSGVDANNIVASTLAASRLSHLGNRSMHALSGGERKRVQIVSSLLTNPKLILLDEPTNHLDLDTVEWLEEFLLNVAEKGFDVTGAGGGIVKEPVAYVIVSHDRALLDTLSAQILEIENGEATLFEGNYEQYNEQKLALTQTLRNDLAATSNTWKRELAWLRAGVKARTTKQVARIERAHALSAKLKGLKTRAAERTSPEIDFSATLRDWEQNDEGAIVPTTRNLGQQELLALKNLSVSHPGNPQSAICNNLNLIIKPRMRVALLGPNGSGKSTLINAVCLGKGILNGSVSWHELAQMAWFDQERAALPRTETPRSVVCPKGDFVSFRGKNLHVYGYLDQFGFSRFDASKTVSQLSGGEQARLLLAKLMLEDANFLVLDEPTNDLDIATLQRLEQSLNGFAGGVLFTSHDRYFLRRVATLFLVWQQSTNSWIAAADLEQAIALLPPPSEPPQQSKNLQQQKENSPKRKTGLSQKEKREWEALEKEIPELEKNIAREEQALMEAYATPEKSRTKATELAEKIGLHKKNLGLKTERWEELFMLQEELSE